jgi:hypothetical protein
MWGGRERLAGGVKWEKRRSGRGLIASDRRKAERNKRGGRTEREIRLVIKRRENERGYGN